MPTAEDSCVVVFICVCPARVLKVASCATKSLLDCGLVGSWSFNSVVSSFRKSLSVKAPDGLFEAELLVLFVLLVYVESVKIGAVYPVDVVIVDVIEVTSYA
jgi:hypothetical protein